MLPQMVRRRHRIKRVEIHDSARKHGVVDEDIHHAIDHALAIEDAGEDLDRWLGHRA
jgi:hypothetical protein